ncbi:class I SAM-dependent methyltransferase [Streptomyces glaucus]|uniref:Class I SAM-dependent methyltransferase n=1 Tax=Streptomyces glaucus TaxID=284029 RepID=A0ABP5X629_9ACTN
MPVPLARQAADRRRAAYLAALADGADRFHEPRRATCPWCGSARLRTRLRSGDPQQRTPGTFAVDACRDCGHVFQNPRLTAEGLVFAHRDVYEGHLEASATRAGLRRTHRRAARAMLRLTEPESWLDVGTGHARFPETARELLPYTAFDGLDPTGRVEEARAAGRIEEAHVGHLTDPRITARLRARYDVVSMLHHLQHVPDPRAELRAALGVLRPGGLLLIELPDPRCVFAALLGRWWPPHDHPRHLHLPPPANLIAELRAQGCTIVAADRRAPHVPCDLAAALSLALAHALPAPDGPWRTALTGAASPLVALASALDHALAPVLRRTPFSNAYRVVARKGASAP